MVQFIGIDTVAVMNDESVTFVAHHTLSELLQGPFSSRMLSDVEVKNASCPNLHDHEHINEPKCRCYDDKKVRCNDRFSAIEK